MKGFPYWLSGLLLLAAAPLWADDVPPGPKVPGEVTAAMGLPPEAAEVQIVQKLGHAVPPGLAFRDETGREVTIGDYFNRGRPVLLVLAYFKCPMLCNQVLNGLLESLRVLQFSPGQEFELVVVSFHPAETPEVAAARKAAFVEKYGRRAAAEGCHFLTGEQKPIDELCDAVGFRKVYDAKRDEFVHASGVMVLTQGGQLSRYLLGIRYPPRDLRLALVEASENKVGTLADQFILLCFHYDPATGTYTPAVMTAVRAGGVLTVLALAGLVVFARMRRHVPKPDVPPAGEGS